MNANDLLPEEREAADFPYRSTKLQALMMAVGIIVAFTLAESAAGYLRSVFPDIALPTIFSFTE
jgi:hypothetical protein